MMVRPQEHAVRTCQSIVSNYDRRTSIDKIPATKKAKVADPDCRIRTVVIEPGIFPDNTPTANGDFAKLAYLGSTPHLRSFPTGIFFKSFDSP